MGFRARTWVLLGLVTSGAFASHASAECYWKAYDSPKDNALYLYFPTSEELLPSKNLLIGVTKMEPFDVAALDSSIGTTTELQKAILDIVTDDYCEFSVSVEQATTSDAPGDSRWQIVGIGGDSSQFFFGQADSVDAGDSDPEGYARVWAGRFKANLGADALAGPKSTLARWARAIGHVASHEAGHNYGIGHEDACPRVGTAEDKLPYHIMADSNIQCEPTPCEPTPCEPGSDELTYEARAANVRHFSDQSYEILGHDIGLNIKTVHNWDFTNPNEKDAHSLTVTLLSEAEDLTMSWSYTGSKSPWINAKLVEVTDDDDGTDDLVSFQGKDYREYEVRFADPQSWNGATPGVVPSGTVFHIGATFQESDAVIVYETTLYGSDGDELPLHPRMIGYEVGPPDPVTGNVLFNVMNTSVSSPAPGPTPGPAPGPGPSDLQVQDLRVFLLPRLADINTMVDRAELKDIRGLDVQQRPLQGGRRPPQSLTVGAEPVKLIIANMNDARHVDITYDATDCEPGFVPADAEGGEIVYCPDGTSLSLFPSTYVYITATIVDPNATHFDVAEGKMVTGPVMSRLFYQVAGIVPDLNKNGVDDLLDIRSSTSADQNKNGVPDEAEPPTCRLWPFIVGVFAVLLILWWFLRRRR